MIVFNKLTFCNILSVGNQPVTVDLSKTKTTLIHGSNGSGKSTILDALCYVLFNKPFRRVNLPQLINTQNKKGLLVEVEFVIGKTQFMVRRGMKPKKFELWVNGEPFTKLAADKDTQAHLEQNILKLTYKSFVQVCILGSANYMPFMQLPTPARRECVEDFLDIKVFTAMALLAKERLKGARDQLSVVKGDIGNVDFKIEVQQDRVNEIERKAKESTKEYKDELKQISTEITRVRALVERVETHQSNVLELCKRLDEVKPAEKVSEVQKITAKLEQKVERLVKDNQFYAKHDDCPTCRQPITAETKTDNIHCNDCDIETHTAHILEGQKALDVMSTKVRILNRRHRHLQSLSNRLTQYHTELKNLELRGKKVVDKVREIEDDTGDFNKEQGKLEVMTDERKRLTSRKEEYESDVKDLDVVSNLLRDGGIKAQIVKKYLPVMNKLIRNYLTELDLPVHFKLDDEFNETVASPLHQDFSYASFSEGQKARIDLALMFTWREIGKMKNSVSTNILFLDEVFSSSLDDTGKELLMALIRYKLPENQNILVVDHTLSENFKEKFQRSVVVSQVKGFSQYST